MNDDAQTKLDLAISELYEVFSAYAAPAVPSASAIGITEADLAALYGPALRDLRPHDVAKYARRALNTWGDTSEFRHFLPRLFELAAREPGSWCDVDLLIGKLQAAQWFEWPEVERSAVNGYLGALWAVTLMRFPAAPRAGEVLGGVALAGADLAPYLHRFREATSIAAARHVVDLIRDNQETLWRRGAVDPDFWGPDAVDVVTRWLRAPETAAALERAFFASEDSPYAADFSDALDILANAPG